MPRDTQKYLALFVRGGSKGNYGRVAGGRAPTRFMRLSEQERSAAQADLDRLTGELVRLYQLREQLKLALSEGEGASDSAKGADSRTDDTDLLPAFRLVMGKLECESPRDEAQR